MLGTASFGTSSARLLWQSRCTQRERDGDSAGKQVLLTQRHLTCRRKKKKVWHHFFLLHKCAKIPTCLLFVQCWTKPGSGGQASLVLPLHSRDTLPQTGPISPTLYLLKDNQKTELSILSISSKPGQLVYMLTTQ